MKLLTPALMMIITLSAHAQGAARNTYIHPDHEFALSVPASHTLHFDITPEVGRNSGCETSGDNWPSPVAGEGWVGDPLSKLALACVAYPGAFPNTTFESAFLEVWKVTNLSTQADCESFSPHHRAPTPDSSSSNRIHAERIHGIPFLVGSFGGVATGHVSDLTIYRSFHRGSCFEMVTSVNFGDYPGDSGKIKQFSNAQVKHVHQQLKQILLTFRFLR